MMDSADEHDEHNDAREAWMTPSTVGSSLYALKAEMKVLPENSGAAPSASVNAPMREQTADCLFEISRCKNRMSWKNPSQQVQKHPSVRSSPCVRYVAGG